VNTGSAQSVQGADKLVFCEQPRSTYSIVFEGSSFTGGSENLIITVKTRREVELLLLILGEEVSVIKDDIINNKFPEVWEWLNERTYSEVMAELKWSYREAEEVNAIIEKIPLLHNLKDRRVKLYNDDPRTERLNQEYVHKVNNENVLVSKPSQCGNMFFFNGFTKSPEFNIDHISDHLEGIIIFEAARQAGLATTHLSGVPFSSRIVLLKTIITYKRYVETQVPYIIHTIPVVRQRGGSFYIVFSIVQDGVVCATGFLSGLQYRTNESYQKHRYSKNFNATTEEAVGA
jgi:hypothetical protein